MGKVGQSFVESEDSIKAADDCAALKPVGCVGGR